MAVTVLMAMADSIDRQFMAEALALARRGCFGTSPNPVVGCVLVRDGRVIGRGWHERAGEPHAEIMALRDAAGDARGATVYVTLEPCSHHGRTGPCSEVLVQAGVARVVAAMPDPNPLVAGQGLERLRAAGIAVEVGLLEAQARALNPGFVQRMSHGRPRLTLKLAMSLDGRTAMASGESQWITGAAARADVQRLRAGSCAILTGIGTVLADDCALSVREQELNAREQETEQPTPGLTAEYAPVSIWRQPLRVVVDSRWRTPVTARVLGAGGGPTLVVGAAAGAGAEVALREAGAQTLSLPRADGRVDLVALLRELAQRGCNEVLAECGAELAAALWQAGLVDRLVVYLAPTLLGSEARPLLALPLQAMQQQQRLVIDSVRAVGEDWRIEARPRAGQPLLQPSPQPPSKESR